MGVIKIYVYFYKKSKFMPLEEMYEPIMCGNFRYADEFNMIGDDTGENISERNFHFSELSGIYWVWKNTKQDIVGSCHYRRFFTLAEKASDNPILRVYYYLSGIFKNKKSLIYSNNLDFWKDKILSEPQLRQLLNQYDGVLPKPRRFNKTVKQQYAKIHNIQDLSIIEDILKIKHPEYLEAFHTLLDRNTLYANNMFILKNPYYEQFMEWWFDMLFEFETRIDIQNYKGYQQRIFGFIAERLLNVWIIKNDLNIIELNVVYFKNLKFEHKIPGDFS
ncbi:MAG TPA: DUF4422 domain-containing protein [Anditalea sp.]|nr:DUF4422 domain-containing protein [Anditalea sp.]